VERQTWKHLFETREAALAALEKARQTKEIGKALEAKVTLSGPGVLMTSAKEHLDALRELLNVSQLEFQSGGEGPLAAAVTKAAGQKCERCWHWETDVGSHSEHPTICGRCVRAVLEAGAV
jgi:isoleucyl-tRNA synthetase